MIRTKHEIIFEESDWPTVYPGSDSPLLTVAEAAAFAADRFDGPEGEAAMADFRLTAEDATGQAQILFRGPKVAAIEHDTLSGMWAVEMTGLVAESRQKDMLGVRRFILARIAEHERELEGITAPAKPPKPPKRTNADKLLAALSDGSHKRGHELLEETGIRNHPALKRAVTDLRKRGVNLRCIRWNTAATDMYHIIEETKEAAPAASESAQSGYALSVKLRSKRRTVTLPKSSIYVRRDALTAIRKAFAGQTGRAFYTVTKDGRAILGGEVELDPICADEAKLETPGEQAPSIEDRIAIEEATNGHHIRFDGKIIGCIYLGDDDRYRVSFDRAHVYGSDSCETMDEARAAAVTCIVQAHGRSPSAGVPLVSSRATPYETAAEAFAPEPFREDDELGTLWMLREHGRVLYTYEERNRTANDWALDRLLRLSMVDVTRHMDIGWIVSISRKGLEYLGQAERAASVQSEERSEGH